MRNSTRIAAGTDVSTVYPPDCAVTLPGSPPIHHASTRKTAAMRMNLTARSMAYACPASAMSATRAASSAFACASQLPMACRVAGVSVSTCATAPARSPALSKVPA